ncbi:MAG TPA: helix-turn-helix domain-containing protein [Abditibacteriaceae bacterium]|jgi:hypothetical protein
MSNNEDTQDTQFVQGDGIEPDESRTPAEFADDELLTFEQVALRMNCSATQVREWVSSGLLTPIPGGSIERIRRSELERVGNPTEEAADSFEDEHQ